MEMLIPQQPKAKTYWQTHMFVKSLKPKCFGKIDHCKISNICIMKRLVLLYYLEWTRDCIPLIPFEPKEEKKEERKTQNKNLLRMVCLLFIISSGLDHFHVLLMDALMNCFEYQRVCMPREDRTSYQVHSNLCLVVIFWWFIGMLIFVSIFHV